MSRVKRLELFMNILHYNQDSMFKVNKKLRFFTNSFDYNQSFYVQG
jgi:hypothetical protein